MGALGLLGVGLSVLFGAFVFVLAAEIYYIACWKRGRGGGDRRVNNVQGMEEGDEAMAREAALVGSFGGYPGSPLLSFAAKLFRGREEEEEWRSYSREEAALPARSGRGAAFSGRFLFTIEEETKEDMEFQKSPQLAVVAEHSATTTTTTNSSSSSSASFGQCSSTPFVTPPTSPSNCSSPSSSMASPCTAVSRFSCATPTFFSSSPASSNRSCSSPATLPLRPPPPFLLLPLSSYHRSPLASLRRPSPPNILVPPRSAPLVNLIPSLSTHVPDFRNARPFTTPSPLLRAALFSPFAASPNSDYRTHF